MKIELELTREQVEQLLNLTAFSHESKKCQQYISQENSLEINKKLAEQYMK